jgi:predicted dehydrogenase
MRYLVIGAGAAGRIHVEQLTRRCYSVQVYDTDAAKAAALAREFGARSVPTRCMVDPSTYDVAVVAVVPSEHYPVALEQVRMGKRVVIEKPLCLDPEHAEALAAEPGVYVAESQAYGNGFADLRKRLDYVCGSPAIWRACYMTPYRPQAWSYELQVGGGAFCEGGIHMLTCARALFGQSAKWQASVRCFAGGTGPDSGTLLIDYEGGNQLCLQLGWGTADAFVGGSMLANSVGFFGPRAVYPWAPADDHSAMWDHLARCLAGEAEPVATAQQAAGAVRDLWMCYAAAGVRYNDVVGVVM